MSREVLDKWCERGIAGLVLAILAFSTLATGAVRTLEFLVVQVLTMAALGLWLVRVWIRPSYRILWPPIAWAVVAFVIYAVFRYRTALIEFTARDELLHVLVYAVLFFLLLDNFGRQELCHWVAFALLSIATLLSLYAVYQYLTDSKYVWHFVKPAAYMGRASGTFICPNHLAGFLEMVLPLGLALVASGRFHATAKVLLAYACLSSVVGIGLTFSRGGWFASILSLTVLGILLFRRQSRRWPAVVFLVVVLVAGAFFVKKYYRPQQRLERFFVAKRVDDIRLQLWKPALSVWQDHFWLGGGPGHFDYWFREYRPADVQLRPVRVHNDYLNALADWGVVGGLLILAAWVLLYSTVFRTWKYVQRSGDLSSKQSNRTAFVLGASIGLLAILLHSFFDFNMYIPANAMVAVSLMALVSTYVRYATDRFWLAPGVAGRLLVTALGGGVLIYLGVQTFGRAQEQMHLRAAARAKEAGAQLEALKKAHAAQPTNHETVYEIGENLRLQGWEKQTASAYFLTESMKWYQLGIQLNPLDPYHYLRYGMCLDRLKDHDEAEDYFQKVLELDPANFYLVSLVGWHYYHQNDHEKAKECFEESLRLSDWRPNDLARMYLRLIERDVAEQAQKGAK